MSDLHLPRFWILALVLVVIVPPLTDALSLAIQLRTAVTQAATRVLLSPETPLQLGVDVVIADSPGRGQGVFACRDIPAGVLVAPYEGWVVRSGDGDEEQPDNRYLFDLGNGFCIDGADPERSNWVRFLNHSRRRVNCCSETVVLPSAIGSYPTGISIRTTRDISEGDELFIDYGDAYWESLDLNPIERLQIHYT